MCDGDQCRLSPETGHSRRENLDRRTSGDGRELRFSKVADSCDWASELLTRASANGRRRELALSAITCRSRSPIERQEQTGCCRSSFAAEWRRLPRAALHTFSWRAAALIRNLTFAAIVEENESSDSGSSRRQSTTERPSRLNGCIRTRRTGTTDPMQTSKSPRSGRLEVSERKSVRLT